MQWAATALPAWSSRGPISRCSGIRTSISCSSDRRRRFARFSLVYGPALEEEKEIALSTDEPAFEPLHGNSIDIGEAVAQELSLALPVYPRDPEAKIDQAAISEPLEGPFTTLARARKDAGC